MSGVIVFCYWLVVMFLIGVVAGYHACQIFEGRRSGPPPNTKR